MFYRLKFWLNSIKRFASKQSPIRLILAVAAVLLAAALIVEGATRPAPSPYVAAEIAEIRDRGVLRVAVRADLPGFAFKDPETGEWSGVEVEAARAIAAAVFGGEEQLEFIESTSRALAHIDNDEADVVFAQLPDTNTRYAYTGAYYTDAYAVMTLAGSQLTSLGALAGSTIGVAQDLSAAKLDEPPAMLALAAWGEGYGHAYTFKLYGSYPELMEALSARAVDAALLPAAYVPKYYGEGRTALTEAISQIGYCAAVRSAETGLRQIASAAIEALRESGELERMRERYQLPRF